MPSRVLAARGDRVAAKSVLTKQQRDMAAIAHTAIRRYLDLVSTAMAHTAVRAAAQPGQGDDINLNALDQSAAWPAILKETILPQIDSIILGLGPQNRMTPTIVNSINAWRAAWLAGRTVALVGVPDTITKQIRDAIQEDADLNGPDPQAAASIVKDLLNPDAPTWLSRAKTIARTEVIGANNQGSLASWTAVHQSIATTGAQVFKTWLATEDATTREDHADIDGTEIGIADTFTVGGEEMTGPGDDSADPDQVINCRCTLTYRVEDGTDGSADDDDVDPESITAAAQTVNGDVVTGAAVLLMLSAADAARLAVDGGEAPEQMHVTVGYLADPAASYSDDVQASILDGLAPLADMLPVSADAFATAHFNPEDDDRDPCAVVLVQSDDLASIHDGVSDAIASMASTTFPIWIPHLTVAYNADPSVIPMGVVGGQLTFDRLVLGWGPDQITVTNPAPSEAAPAVTAASEAPVTAPTTTPDSKPYEPAPYKPEPDETVTCPNCSKVNDTDAKFCDQCGFKLEGATDVVVAPAPADATTAAALPPPATDAPAAPAAPPALVSPAGAMQWTGVLCTLDTPSSDGRMIASTGLTIRTLPLPLSYQCEGSHGGDEAGTTVIVGRILTAEIQGNQVIGTGDFFDPMTSLAPTSALEQVAAGIGGVSINLPVQIMSYMAPGPDGTLLPIDPMQYMGDPDSIVMVAEQSELAGATIVDTPAFGDARITLVTDPSAPSLTPVTADAASPQGPVLTADSVTFPDGTVLNVGDTVNVAAEDGTTSSGLIESIDPDSNQVSIAIEDPTDPSKTNTVTVDVSMLQIDGDNTSDAGSGSSQGGTSSGPDGVTASALTAAIAFPGLTEEHVYQAEWFSLPDLEEIERRPHIGVTEDGRVFGLLAQAGSCHIGFANECVAPPTSPSNYAYFHVGEIKTDQGMLPVGKLTVGGGHADMGKGWRGATEHYDNAGAATAVVRAFDTPIGVVVAGALLPHATGTQIAALRRNDCSGDWRPIGGNRELVAALSINTGGFPLTPRAALAADGRPMALVAAGVVHNPDSSAEGAVTLPSGTKLSPDDIAVIASAFADQLDQRHESARGKQQQRVADARRLRTRLELKQRLRSVS